MIGRVALVGHGLCWFAYSKRSSELNGAALENCLLLCGITFGYLNMLGAISVTDLLGDNDFVGVFLRALSLLYRVALEGHISARLSRAINGCVVLH